MTFGVTGPVRWFGLTRHRCRCVCLSRAGRFCSMYSEAKSRGALILFEGIDKSGKSTQAKILVQKLTEQKVPVQHVCFPDRRTPIGSVLNDYLSGGVRVDPGVTHLLFAANRLEKRDEILKMLEEGKTVVMDRFAHSGAAYTSAKRKEGLDMRWCKAVEGGKLPSPDVLFYMSLPIHAAAERAGFGNEKYETHEFQNAVRLAFEELMVDENWTVIDAEQKPEEISEFVLSVALNTIETCKTGRKLNKLWPLD